MINKTVTVVFWCLALVAWQQQWQGWLAMLPVAALVVAAIHLLEVAYFWFSLKPRSQQPVKDALQILLFGIFHLQRFMRPAGG